MFALFPMGVPWRRKAGVSETANGDAAMVRSLIGSPVYRRSTRGAEVEVDRKSASSLAAVYIAGPFRSNVFFQKVFARMNHCFQPLMGNGNTPGSADRAARRRSSNPSWGTGTPRWVPVSGAHERQRKPRRHGGRNVGVGETVKARALMTGSPIRRNDQ